MQKTKNWKSNHIEKPKSSAEDMKIIYQRCHRQDILRNLTFSWRKDIFLEKRAVAQKLMDPIQIKRRIEKLKCATYSSKITSNIQALLGISYYIHDHFI